MENFAKAEKKRLGLLNSPSDERPQVLRTRKPSQASASGEVGSSGVNGTDFRLPAPRTARERKLSQSNAMPRRHGGGKMALFEGLPGAPPASLSAGIAPPLSVVPSYADLPATAVESVGHDRPYRFSFYSNALSATIHARSLSELPADGQSFEDMFSGVGGPAAPQERRTGSGLGPQLTSPFSRSNREDAKILHVGNGRAPLVTDADFEGCTWWLDILSPTDEEMKMLSKVFGIHPLTAEDIQMEEAREKIELFRTYYLVCFRSFDQDPYSPTHLEPLNMYIIVFREGILSFHFRPTPHPQNVRRRIKQLKDYISVTSDWISYALIDDITDAFGPLIQSIEYEVDSIDELVLILKDAEQSDMLRRIGRCRKKVMGLLRLMGNKADVVKGLAKRCNENWKVAPTSDIGLYLSDIQDHLITMTQNLNHYEKILSRTHSNYLAQISIEMTDANNQINEVLSKLTALGTILIPMNLITGLWGMNVHVPGQDIEGFAWFSSIVGALVTIGLVGGYSAYKLMVR
ncbi:cora-domain-containing protein [Lactarius psammicola]|nr:cora-domain-containing protein [Lactarius psammicola]